MDGLCWQHTPRVNGEIPDVNDATVDHERLLERFYLCLQLYMQFLIDCFFGKVCYLYLKRNGSFTHHNLPCESIFSKSSVLSVHGKVN